MRGVLYLDCNGHREFQNAKFFMASQGMDAEV